MKKETYERTQLEIIRFHGEDVLAESEYEVEPEGMIRPPLL